MEVSTHLLAGLGHQMNLIVLEFVVSYIKGGTKAKVIGKQDPEANIWTQEGGEWGMEKTPQ